MKYFGLLLLGLIFPNLLIGQEYHPIVQDNKDWNILSVGYNSWFTDTTYTTWNFKFEGDTSINNTSYQKVYVSLDNPPTEWAFECCIREDSDKKVFKHKWQKDYLIYDFGSEIGDTVISYYNYGDSSVLIVESIELIEIDGNLRRKLTLGYNQSNHYETWIEGIGSNRGVLQAGTANFVGGWRWLMCMSELGQLIYMSPNFNSCNMTNTNTHENNDIEIQIFPNPAKDRIQIQKSSNLKIVDISLIDTKGQIKRQFNSNQDNLNLSGIPSGIYLIKLEHEKGKIIKKFLIE